MVLRKCPLSFTVRHRRRRIEVSLRNDGHSPIFDVDLALVALGFFPVCRLAPRQRDVRQFLCRDLLAHEHRQTLLRGPSRSVRVVRVDSESHASTDEVVALDDSSVLRALNYNSADEALADNADDNGCAVDWALGARHIEEGSALGSDDEAFLPRRFLRFFCFRVRRINGCSTLRFTILCQRVLYSLPGIVRFDVKGKGVNCARTYVGRSAREAADRNLRQCCALPILPYRIEYDDDVRVFAVGPLPSFDDVVAPEEGVELS